MTDHADLRTRTRGRRLANGVALGVALGWLACGASSVRAAGTDPTLALTGAKVVAGASGTVGVQVTGSFEFEDLVQGAIPAGLIVFQADRFVRYDIAGTIAQGVSNAVTDGVTADEIDLLIASGGAATGASLSAVSSAEILCTLPTPPYFASGNAAAVIFVHVEGESFVSNTINFTVP